MVPTLTSDRSTVTVSLGSTALFGFEMPSAVMTGGAAAALGLADRGILREGQAADVVLFDPATNIDRATFDDPHQYPAGIGTVIANGTVVIDDGEHTGALPGRLLRRRGTVLA